MRQVKKSNSTKGTQPIQKHRRKYPQNRCISLMQTIPVLLDRNRRRELNGRKHNADMDLTSVSSRHIHWLWKGIADMNIKDATSYSTFLKIWQPKIFSCFINQLKRKNQKVSMQSNLERNNCQDLKLRNIWTWFKQLRSLYQMYIQFYRYSWYCLLTWAGNHHIVLLFHPVAGLFPCGVQAQSL